MGGAIVQRGFIAFRRMLLLSGTVTRRKFRSGSMSRRSTPRSGRSPSPDADALELRGSVRFFRWLSTRRQIRTPGKPLRCRGGFQGGDHGESGASHRLEWAELRPHLGEPVRPGEARGARAYESDPYLKDAHKTIWRLFQNSVELGNRNEADRWCSTGRQRFPDNFRFTECRLWLYDLPGKTTADSVWKAYRDFLEAARQARSRSTN